MEGNKMEWLLVKLTRNIRCNSKLIKSMLPKLQLKKFFSAISSLLNILSSFIVIYELLSAINHQQSSSIILNNNPAVLASNPIFQPKSIKHCFVLVCVQQQCFICSSSLNFSVLGHLKCCTFRQLNPVTECAIFLEKTST